MALNPQRSGAFPSVRPRHPPDDESTQSVLEQDGRCGCFTAVFRLFGRTTSHHALKHSDESYMSALEVVRLDVL